MALGDIALSNEYSKDGIESSNPIAGENVYIKFKFNGFGIYKNNNQIVRLSNATNDKPERISSKIIQKQNEGYRLEDTANIDYIVLWQDKNSSLFFKQVLCTIYMIKN